MHYYVIAVPPSLEADALDRLMAPHEGKRWDWYQIGGRWTGALSGYDPTKDPANIETCDLCNGTGRRDDAVGREIRATNPKFTCNACDGQGKRQKWPTDRTPHAGDVQPITDELIEKIAKDPPYAIVTDKGWLAKEHYEPSGKSIEEKFPKTPGYVEKIRRLLAARKGRAAVVVDCHN